MKRLGLFLATDPAINLSKEGLGVHLLNVLVAFAHRSDLRLVVACPAQLVPQLEALLAERRISPDRFEWITPGRTRPRPRGPALPAKPRQFPAAELPLRMALQQYLRGLFTVGRPVQWLRHALGGGLTLASRILRRLGWWQQPRRLLQQGVGWVRRYPLGQRLLPSREQRVYRAIVGAGVQVEGWYCPMAFWPTFNQLAGPRLMVVPDLIPRFFPAGFARADMLSHIRAIEQSVRGGDRFLTYSEQVKWEVLVDGLGVNPSRVAVVRHGANRLDAYLQLEGVASGDPALAHYCRTVLHQLVRQRAPGLALGGSAAFPFIFYASRFRPHKNILSLLRAYEFLLRRRFVGHKLVLTDLPANIPQVKAFVKEKALERDVLFLSNLSMRELASLYYLADLAINPSLMEGGFPFTFTEALSVGTPVVMARIPVTLEVITDPVLDQAMLFDPHDWQDMAHRIEWALAHREELLAMQQPHFEQLAQRTWQKVAHDILTNLEAMVGPSNANR